MNADDRNPNDGGQPSATPPSEQQPVRRAGMMPPSGSVPQRTAFRPITGTQQTGAPQPGAGAPQPGAGAPQPGARPTGSQPTGERGPGQPSTSQHQTAQRPSSFAPQGPATTSPRPEVSPERPASAPGTGAPQSGETESHGAVGAAQEKLKSAASGLGRFTSAAKEKVTSSDDKPQSTPAVQGAPRKVRVLLSRIDPWSALKIGFLLSIAAGIMLVVAVHVLWTALDSMGTFVLVQEWVSKLFTRDQEVNILQFVDYQKVLSATLLVAVTNVVLISGLSVIAAFLYNMVSRMVGGVYVTLTDD